MSNIIEKTAIQSVTEQFSIYGEYVALHRHIPYALDGLKPSYRRLIQAAFELCRNDRVKTAKLIGHTIGNLHPHGDRSCVPVVTQLVNCGIFEGQGNFGFDGILDSFGAAAPRYTEVKLSDNWNRLLSPLIEYIPKFTNELGHTEFEYLPVPIPLGLTFGYLGIAIGTGCRIPEFTPKSILDAYLNDDPLLLKNASGLRITNPEELHRLWNEGRGHLRYAMNVYRDKDRVYVEGNTGCIKPNFTKIMNWKDSSRIGIIDESSEVSKVGFYKLPRVQWPSIEEIEEEVIKSTSGSESYYIRVVANGSVRDVGLKNWIDITYKNYKKLIERYKSDKIQKLEFDILVYKNFRIIADFLIKDENKNVSYSEVASKFNVPIEVVNNISGKTIHQLRTYDPISKIDGANKQIDEFKKLNSDDYISSIINNMEKSN